MKPLIGLLMLLTGLLSGFQAQPDEAILFDDFSYTTPDEFEANGWIIREGSGWPGVPGAIWRAENVSLEDGLLTMTSAVDGTHVYQTQVCHQRKYLEGTYASRIYFSDSPAVGPDGDQIVQTFYLISPQEYDLDPSYSELDFEYLPNGGWGNSESILFATTWETFRLDPWLADNTSATLTDSMEGWHTLVMQIADEEVHYFVDGELLDTHGGKFYPEVPMSINFNLWFINGGLTNSDKMREYVEQIDWVFFAADMVLSPEEVESRVGEFQSEDISFMDTVPEWDTALISPCDF